MTDQIICDGCGEKHNKEETTTIVTETVAGVVLCKECKIMEAANRVIKDHEEAFRKLAEKQLAGHYVMDHPDFYLTPDLQKAAAKDDHPPECKWHKDWHNCDCGNFDGEEK